MKWWFNLKNKFSFVKIPIGITLLLLALFSLYEGIIGLVDAFRVVIKNSLAETALFIILLPFTAEFFFFSFSFYSLLLFSPNIKEDYSVGWKGALIYLLLFTAILASFAFVGGLILRFLFGFNLQIGTLIF